MTAPRVLLVNSGSQKKRFTLRIIKSHRVEIVLLNPAKNWANPYCVETITTKGLRLQQILDQTLELHSQRPFDGILTFWEEDVPTCAIIGQALGLRSLPVQTAFRARSKFLMRQALAAGGVPVPAFRAARTLEEVCLALEDVGTPAVVKPEWGADSEWVMRVDDAETFLPLCATVQEQIRVQESIYPYRTNRFVVEQYLQGPEVSVEGVVQSGRLTVYAVIDKAKMQEPYFIERGEILPSLLPPAAQEAILQMVHRAVRALGLTDSGIHAEVKLTPEGPRIVELGARMGGDCIHQLVQTVYGIDLVEENLKVALGHRVSPPAPPRGWAFSHTLVPDRAGRVRYLADPQQFAKRPQVIELVCTKKPGEWVKTPPEGYDNLAWITIGAPNYQDGRALLHHMAGELAATITVDA